MKKLILWTFIKFDWVIRFLYTQLGPVSVALSRFVNKKLYRSDQERLTIHFDSFFRKYIDNFGQLTGKKVVEIGPGNSIITAAHFLMKGAEQVILADKYPRTDAGKMKVEELHYIENIYGRKVTFVDEGLNIDSNRLQFWAGDLENYPDRDVDVFYSVSVLEHVRNLQQVFKKITDSLSVGGCMFHRVDLRDHYKFEYPFLFYKYSDKSWDRWYTKEGISYTNRKRYPYYAKLIKELNLEVIKNEVFRHTLENVKIHQDMELIGDLDIAKFEILLKKS